MSTNLQLERRLAGYALAAGAAVAATQAARAAIVYPDVNPDQVFTFGAGPQTYILDLNNNAAADFEISFYTTTWGGGTYQGYYRSVRIEPVSGNAVLNSGNTARALNSNYLIGAGASNWNTNVGWMAWQGSTVYTTGAVSKWSGGYFLGRNRRMLGLRFVIGAGTHYGWCRVSVDKLAKQFTVHDYAYDDTVDEPILAGQRFDAVLAGTVGSHAALTATVVPDVGANFAEMPKVVGWYCDPVKGKKLAKTTFKGVLSGDTTQVILDVKKKVRLYDQKAFKAAYKAGTICNDFLPWQPFQGMYFDLEVTHNVGGVPQADTCAHLSLTPPEITVPIVGALIPAANVTVEGNWFGVKAPKAWVEYIVNKGGANIVKQLKLKALKPYVYDDAKGKPNASCMNVDTGASEVIYRLPDAFPDDFDTISAGTHYLVIDNGIGLATRQIFAP